VSLQRREDEYMRVYKHVADMSNICCKLRYVQCRDSHSSSTACEQEFFAHPVFIWTFLPVCKCRKRCLYLKYVVQTQPVY
jgi:hypothetical protein